MVKKKLAKKPKTVTKAVKFQLPSPEAKSVYLVGSFNDWDTTATPMKKDNSGIWKRDVKLTSGTYEYLFYVDGEWKNDPNGTEVKENPFGTMNNVLVIK